MNQERGRETAPWDIAVSPEDPGYAEARETTLGFYARIYAEMASELCRTFGDEGREALILALRRYVVRRLEMYGPVRSGLNGKKTGCALRAWWDKYGYQEEADTYCDEVCPGLAPEAAREGRFTRNSASCFANALLPKNNAYRTLLAEFQYTQDTLCLVMYFLTRELLLRFGLEGDAAARRALRRYAFDRGKLLRAAHEAKGMPIDLITLFHNQDLPTDPRFERNELKCEPEERFNENFRCPFNDVWSLQEDGKRIGRMYCEEVHIPLWTGWHPQTQVHLGQTLTQGDDRCRFSVYLRPSNSIPEPAWLAGRKPNC